MKRKNRLILGLAGFGPPGSELAGARNTCLDDFNNCLEYFRSQGYADIDTGRDYIEGSQESFTRQTRWKELDLSVATKCYPTYPGRHTPENLRASLEQSLAELGTDHVKIFYLHAPDRSVPFVDTLRACNDLFEEGKFHQLGLSNFPAWEVAELYMVANEKGWIRPTIYQAMYNAITRDMETELIPCCRKFGLDVVVYNPLAGGALTGAYESNMVVPAEGPFSNVNESIGKVYRQRYFHDSTFAVLQQLKPVLNQHGLTLIETALRWLVHHSMLNLSQQGSDGIVIGVDTLAQLESNLRDLEKGPLPDNVVDALDEAWSTHIRGKSAKYFR